MPKKRYQRKEKLTVLGRKVTNFTRLETFPKPGLVSNVNCWCDEVTAVCPVTKQPDQYLVEIDYAPDRLCVESKSLKLYLHKFRNAGHFCEAFAEIIARGIYDALQPHAVTVTVTQKSRGGISIKAKASL